MLHDHTLTGHVQSRMRQRGLRDDDLRLLLETASQVSPDAYLLTERDAAREIAMRKREIQQIGRLKGCKVVIQGDAVITCYHSRLNDQKKTLRRGRTAQ
jgi:hypothetical protein